MTAPDSKRLLVLGAGGLIGSFIAGDLKRRGFGVVAVARRFTPAQRAQFGVHARELSIVDLPAAALAALVRDSGADIIVNCLGVLQDGPGGRTHDVHDGFVNKFIAALRLADRPVLLVHVSIPGNDADDRTDFSRSKRSADRLIIASGLPYAILRPGFVFAPAAYGGSALFRALATTPFGLPAAEAARPFAYVAVEDIAETVAGLAQRWNADDPAHAADWDVMHPARQSVGDVAGTLRRWLGVEGSTIRTPQFLLDIAAKAGDLAAFLGWAPPIRTTALTELRRGVEGDPSAWLAATGIAPRALADVLAAHPATVQEKWFARLFLLKAVILASLVLFWCASGIIALAFAYPAAVAILTSHGFSQGQAELMTVASSTMDFLVGVAIAYRRTSRAGLFAGIAVSLFYMIAAAVLTPDLWIEPLGALVKTFPAIVLMLVALAIDDNR